MTDKKPLFITFEGGEGCGKTKQIALFYPWFKEIYDNKAVSVREPGSIPFSEKIRELLLSLEMEELDKMTELFLFEAARVEFYQEVVIPNLNRGNSVISDRSFDSTTAY